MREALTIVQVIHILSDIVASGSKKPGLESHFFFWKLLLNTRICCQWINLLVSVIVFEMVVMGAYITNIFWEPEIGVLGKQSEPHAESFSQTELRGFQAKTIARCTTWVKSFYFLTIL